MPESTRIDPELEGLLREVAADPRSQLLRVKRPGDLVGIFERAPVATVASAGLSKAERHLIEAHRRELAFVLREACYNRFLSDPKLERWIGRYHTIERRMEPTDMSRWRERAMREMAVSSNDPAVCDAGTVLERCVAASVFHDADIAQLAAASIRLEPTDQARMYVALDLITKEQPEAALRILKGVLEGLPSTEHASRAWQLVGVCRARLHALERAYEAAEESYGLGDPRPESYFNALSYGLMAENLQQVLTTSRRLADVVPNGHESIPGYVKLLESQRRSGIWIVKTRTQNFISTVADDLGVAARRIAHALT